MFEPLLKATRYSGQEIAMLKAKKTTVPWIRMKLNARAEINHP
jgi:hypothetical protein